MFVKITWLLIQFLRQSFLLILSSFKNLLELLFVLYQVQDIVKEKNWLEFLIIQISSLFLGIWQVIITFRELLLMSISGCLFSDFHFIKTFLVIEIFHLFYSSAIITFSIWWTFILILLNQLWSVLRILKSIFEIFWSCLMILILEIIYRTLFTLIICLIVMISLLL